MKHRGAGSVGHGSQDPLRFVGASREGRGRRRGRKRGQLEGLIGETGSTQGKGSLPTAPSTLMRFCELISPLIRSLFSAVPRACGETRSALWPPRRPVPGPAPPPLRLQGAEQRPQLSSRGLDVPVALAKGGFDRKQQASVCLHVWGMQTRAQRPLPSIRASVKSIHHTICPPTMAPVAITPCVPQIG